MLCGDDPRDDAEPLLPCEPPEVEIRSPGRRDTPADVHYVHCDPKLCAIFVVAFDTREGNVIEWCYPDDYDLTGVEFKAMPSGAHNVQHDVVVFEVNGNFGMAAFMMKQVENTAERGARMKSVGVVTRNYPSLAPHEERLVEFAQQCVEYPGSAYTELIQYFVGHNESCGGAMPVELKPPTVGTVYDLLKSQGVNIFILWKFLLLKKRVLLQCTPPISRQCGYVAALAAMTYTQYTESQPIFFVTVNEMTDLQLRPSYIACSADSILRTKGNLVYDAYVTGSSVLNGNDEVITVTRGDIARFTHLSEMVDAQYGRRNTSEIDRMIIGYFTQLTEDLFLTFSELMGGSRRVQSQDLKDIRFHSSDLPFIQTLVDKLGYDIEVSRPGCCEEYLHSVVQ